MLMASGQSRRCDEPDYAGGQETEDYVDVGSWFYTSALGS